ncbi:MAG TPA: NAD(P)-dependent oxidoreductase [Devosiaceae bacterium]
MKTIAVTGGTGSRERGIGPVVLNALRERGYQVFNLDIAAPAPGAQDFRQVDLTRYGDTFAALSGADAVVHLAANANPDFDHFTGAQRFHTNTLSTYNVFQAAIAQGMQKVVWASSETVLGFPYDTYVPPELPTHDDDPAVPTGSYGISKAVCENLAEHLYRMHGMPIIGLRFSNIYYDIPGHETGYDRLPAFWDRPADKKFNLWGYVDSRDIAQGVWRALESDIRAARNYTLAAADTNMPQTNQELLAECFAGVKLRPGTGPHDTLIGIDRARKELGYTPQYSWRDILGTR